jgi:hypothetical protein
MGEIPDWYSHLSAAKYLGVAPWELGEQPVFWRNAALVAADVEHRYQQDQEKRQQNRR